MNITIEQIETIVSELEATAATRRAKLRRLIAAYARIIHLKSPENFPAQPTEYRDEAGHYDNSYPAAILFQNNTGPKCLEVAELDWEQVPTTSGYYYDYKVAPTDPGIYVLPDGNLLGAVISGTGSFGQFAARPGNHNVECGIEYTDLDPDKLSISQLEQVELHLRTIAFPSATKND